MRRSPKHVIHSVHWSIPFWIVGLLFMVGSTRPALALQQRDASSPPLSGIFTITIAKDDIPPELPGGAALIGTWTLDLRSDSTFSLARNDAGEVVTGAFDVGPATLSFKSWSGSLDCNVTVDGQEPATYAWQDTAGQLVLTSIDDACAERLTLLTTAPLSSFASCAPPVGVRPDPFAAAENPATPVSAPAAGQGVAAQEGYAEDGEPEVAIDGLLRVAGGCWATADVGGFLALHSSGVLGQIETMGPADDFRRELTTFMEMPLVLERIGPVNLDDPRHAWAYIEVNLDNVPTPQRVNFVQEQGAWLFDSFFLFGPPAPEEITGPGI